MKETERNLQGELVEEAVRQMQKNGVYGFSARAVAEACGVSCAAPFKYFDGRRGLFVAMSAYLDHMLLKIMEEIEERLGTEYKKAHLEMNVAYIHFLCQNPFLISESFWKTIDERQAGIRKWKSFQKMAAQFRMYCQERQIPEEVYKSYYFNFQTLAYGAAFVTVNGLLLEGINLQSGIEDLQERIYRNLEQTMGLA
ncbi:MAG: TetR/AcrR family transcriptional regulator [Hungatella sp.]|nr:TetR/AcrR family transcriptional regulator [Hungatella sp.]